MPYDLHPAPAIQVKIIISLKGAIPDFVQSLHCASECLQHVHSSGQGAVERESRANTSDAYHVQRDVCHVVQMDSSVILSLAELKSHSVLALIG